MSVYSPLSPTSKVSLIQVIRTEELVRDWKEGFNIDIKEELKGHPEIHLYKCAETDLEFFSPKDVAGSGWLYEQLESLDWYYMPRKWEHDIAFSDLKGLKKVLEVGCGRGSFVKRLGDSLEIDALGIEINQHAVKVATDQNIPVLEKDLFEFAEEHPESFDAVCAFQVLEHVPEPLPFLQAMIQLLRPNGKIILSVPNSDFFIRHDPKLLLNQPPHHMTHWNRKAFQKLPNFLPVTLHHFRAEPLSTYHIDWYLAVQRFRFRKHIRRWNLVEKALKLALIRVNITRQLIPGHTLYVSLTKSTVR